VRKLRAYGYDCTGGGGVNNFTSYATISGTYSGRVSMGRYGDVYRAKISDTTVTESNGSHTWAGSGMIRTYSSVDVSSYTNVFWGIDVGAYHAQTTQALTAVIGCCNGSNTAISGTTVSRSVLGERFIWWSKPLATLVAAGVSAASAYFYLSVTISGATSKWWADGPLICDAASPPMWRPKNQSSAVSNTGKGFKYLTPVLCPRCADERLLKPSEDQGEPRMAEWVEIRDQIESL